MARGDLLNRKNPWIQTIWKKFNNVIEKFSNGIQNLPEPNLKTIEDSDIQILNNKIKEIKKDLYLSSEADLFVTHAVSRGQLLTSEYKQAMDKMVDGFGVLVCKNIATQTNGMNENGYNSKGYNSYGSHSHGTNSHGKNSHGKNSYGDCTSNGTWSPRSSTSNTHLSRTSNSTVKTGRGTSYSNGAKENGQNSYGNCEQNICSKGTCSNQPCTSNTACTSNQSCRAKGTCSKGEVIQLRCNNKTILGE